MVLHHFIKHMLSLTNTPSSFGSTFGYASYMGGISTGLVMTATEQIYDRLFKIPLSSITPFNLTRSLHSTALTKMTCRAINTSPLLQHTPLLLRSLLVGAGGDAAGAWLGGGAVVQSAVMGALECITCDLLGELFPVPVEEGMTRRSLPQSFLIGAASGVLPGLCLLPSKGWNGVARHCCRIATNYVGFELGVRAAALVSNNTVEKLEKV
eukprot:gnl/Dysnectes_brevis/6028_a9056_400.p1 GENE.gnl/Dysnectes_brevis/6028_a9056_400~~gnl/Dysnectes_brevis/6028_a9056_400.p1  ORF type:complete len:210 (+),score=29.61 gnl/Dysnectes_brevis/6028_a9056_400:343-972(+)